MEHGAAPKYAAAAIAEAGALLVTAGAGMGVDSGLPDFRGDQGFWRAYPPFQKLGLSFVDLANPRWFQSDPALAWGFYGHRLNAYRAAQPHAGFARLREWMGAKAQGGFVFTSNVDGQFERAGFDAARIVECHGSLHHVQCTRNCGAGIASAEAVRVVVDETTMRACDPLPNCGCGALLRPNVLMFGDSYWDDARTRAQEERLDELLARVPLRRVVVVELGAGRAVPTVRHFGERLAALGATLVRINPREPEVPAQLGARAIGVPLGALEGVEAIAAAQ